MAGHNPENKIRIINSPTTEELATGKVGEETIEHLAGGEILTRREITRALGRGPSFMGHDAHGQELVEDLGITHEELHERLERETKE